MTKILLWDIDGTLIRNSDHNVDKHFESFKSVTGQGLELGKNTSGMTDREIIISLFEKNQVSYSEKVLLDIYEQLNLRTKSHIENVPSNLCPNVLETLNITSIEGWINGLLTGNTSARARIKLDNTGIWQHLNLEFCFYGEKAASRQELIEVALQKIKPIRNSRIILIGDTPLDIIAAKKTNLPIVSVSTGSYLLSNLINHKPNLAIKNLVEGFDHFFKFINNPNL
jgi:phosphoglycolate phosphatase